MEGLRPSSSTTASRHRTRMENRWRFRLGFMWAFVFSIRRFGWTLRPKLLRKT